LIILYDFNFLRASFKESVWIGIIVGFLGLAVPEMVFAEIPLSVETELKQLSTSNLKEVYKGPFRHPFKLRPQTTQSLLESIRYSKNFITWSKPMPLFSSVIAENMARPLLRGFAKANRKQLVTFKVNHQKFQIEGEAFVNKYGLNWKIKSFHTRSKGFRESKVWDDNWKLMLNKNQFYWKTKDLFGNNVKDVKWILIPSKKLKTVLSTARREASLTTQNAKTFNGEKFLADLRSLKGLYKSGTLSRKEYYERLDKVIKSSDWNEQPLQKQSQVFKLINKENLLPGQKRP
jgi:hypothetical protein